MPVIVIVAGANPLSPTGWGEPGLGRNVHEVALAVVMVELRAATLAGLRLERGAVREEQVVMAVTVVVEDGDAVAGGFENVVFAKLAAIDVLESEP